MAHGAPDWFGRTPQGLVHRVADEAELAVRLGAFDLFDRRGNVLFQDSFENGLEGWVINLSGGVADIYPVMTPVRTGALAVGIYTDALADAASGVRREFGLPLISRMGSEIAFMLDDNTMDVLLWLQVVTSTWWWSYAARWRQNLGVLSVYNDAGAWQTVATPGMLNEATPTWYVIKLVCDPVNGRYTRLILNAVEYDISTIIPWNFASVQPPFCRCWIQASSSIAASREIVIDDFILTMNE
jgi:hypothetical protein